MLLFTVVSSLINSIGHNAETFTLRIAFRSGGVYDYANVSAAKFTEMANSFSPGKYFFAHIKDNPAHPFTKVDPNVKTSDSPYDGMTREVILELPENERPAAFRENPGEAMIPFDCRCKKCKRDYRVNALRKDQYLPTTCPFCAKEEGNV